MNVKEKIRGIVSKRITLLKQNVAVGAAFLIVPLLWLWLKVGWYALLYIFKHVG